MLNRAIRRALSRVGFIGPRIGNADRQLRLRYSIRLQATSFSFFYNERRPHNINRRRDPLPRKRV